MSIAVALCALLLSADPDVAKFDDLWAHRDDATAAADLGKMAADFKGTTDYDKLWRTSRWYSWVAEGDPNDDQKKNDSKLGWDVGEAAKRANPQGLEGKFWTSVNIGTYSEAVGIMTALTQGLEGKFKDPILEVVKADPNNQNANVNYVGPETVMGRFYYKLPWPKHSDDKSKEWLNRAIKAHPESLRAHYYLADTIKGDDKAAARKELDLVLAGDESYDPPEARRLKKKAQALLAKIGK